MPLSRVDKQQAENLAHRLYTCINAMDEAGVRLHHLPEAERLELYNKVMSSPDAPGSEENKQRTPEVKDIDSCIQNIEEKINYHTQRNTYEGAMWLLAFGSAGSLTLDNHLTYNHPRLKLTVIRKMTQLHKDGLNLRRQQIGLTPKEDHMGGGEPVEDVNQNVANQSDQDLWEVFWPSVIARESQRSIEIEDFKALSLQNLFCHIFYVDNPDYAHSEDHAAFEVLGRKETRKGTFYEVRWQGFFDSIDVDFEELRLLAKRASNLKPDPAGVKALLETLRKSQAWQDLDDQKDTTQCQANVELPDNTSPSVPKKSVTPEVLEDASKPSPDILSLLARLQSTTEATSSRSTSAHIPTDRHVESAYPGHAPVALPFTRPPSILVRHEKPVKKTVLRPKSLRNMAYGQALLVIAELASDASFHQELKKIREQQNSLEKRLWEERTRIFEGQEERIKVAQRKAAIIGVNISEKELNGFRTSFMDEIKEFDLERVSSAWDSLLSSQQRTLEELGVPGMFVTRDKVEREKQQRIIQVLEGLSGPEDSDISANAEIEQEEEP